MSASLPMFEKLRDPHAALFVAGALNSRREMMVDPCHFRLFRVWRACASFSIWDSLIIVIFCLLCHYVVTAGGVWCGHLLPFPVQLGSFSFSVEQLLYLGILRRIDLVE